MILVTGGTGFIGNVLVRNLVSLGYPIRLLLNPSNETPRLPPGLAVDVAISSLDDERSIRASLKGIRTIFHLVGTESRGINAEFSAVDILSAKRLAVIAREMEIDRFFYLSHLGADRHSAYPYLKAKAEAEAAIIASGVPYTILRTAAVYGKNDHFTEVFARYIRVFPRFVPIPGDGSTKLQPLWVDDLVTCLLLCFEDEGKRYSTVTIGGMESLSIEEILLMIMDELKIRKSLLHFSPVWHRQMIIALEQWFPRFPRSYFWTDYLAEDRITGIDVLPREFSLIPTRLSRNLAYLNERG